MRGFTPITYTDEFRKEIQQMQTQSGLILPEERKSVTVPMSKTKDIFSPKNFAEYIGQTDAKDLASIMVRAAHNERRTLPNIMVVGEYGLGKTSLARLIMGAAGLSERMYDGSSINKELPGAGTFIIDEIHNLDSSVADTLNLYLDNNQFHIIGCTNNPGLLPSAFRSRFRMLYLKSYSNKEIALILKNACDRKGVKTTPTAIELLSFRARSNARQATMYLSMVFDVMAVKGITTVTKEVVSETFEKLGVDARGLLPRDRDYLEALPDRPVGLQYLTARLGIDANTIEEEVEPFLLRLGLIDRTPRGRIKIEG